MRRKFGADLEVETHAPAFREVMTSSGVQQRLSYEATRARLRAEAVSGLRFHSGVDVYAVNARGWVGAPAHNIGHLKKQVEALSKALHGV